MKIKLQFEQKDSPYGYKETKLARVRLNDDEGKYVKFIKQTPELVQFLQQLEIEIPNEIIK